MENKAPIHSGKIGEILTTDKVKYIEKPEQLQ